MKQLLLLAIAASCFSSGCTSQQKQRFDIVTIVSGKGAASVEVADLNKDGLPDIVVANAEDSSVTILLNKGQRQFSPAPGSPFYAGHFPNDINIADFNKDGNLDLAFANHEKKYLTVLLGNGKGQFLPAVHSPFSVQVKPHTHGVISGDFNGDGNLDLVTESWGVDSIVVLAGDGKGDFSDPVFYATGKHPYQRLRTADLNKDGIPDIVTTDLDGDNVTILLGNGKGGFSAQFFAAGNTPFGMAIGDVNADGNLDLAIVDAPSISGGKSGKDGMNVLIGDGKGHFSLLAGSPFETGIGPTRAAIGDLDHDGVNDIAVTNYKSNFISIYFMGSHGLKSTITIPMGTRSDGIAIRDLDGDGKEDIVVSSAEEGVVRVLFQR